MAIKTQIDTDLGRVIWTSTDGERLTVSIHMLSAANRQYAALHGIKQKVGDAAALGESASDAEKFSAMREVANHLESGSDEWNLGRSSIGGILVQALVAAGKVDSPELRATLKAMSAAERTALQNSDTVKPHYDAIVAARTKSVDVSGLLAKL